MNRDDVAEELLIRIADKQARRGKIGKPLNLTFDKIDAVVDMVSKGAIPVSAAVRAGMSSRSHMRYMAKGRDENEAIEDAIAEAVDDEDPGEVRRLISIWSPSIFWRYWQRVNAAERDSVSIAEDVVVYAIVEGDVDAAKWWLSKRAPKDYGNRSVVDTRLQNVDGTGNASIAFDLSKFTPEQLKAIVSGDVNLDDVDFDAEFEDE